MTTTVIIQCAKPQANSLRIVSQVRDANGVWTDQDVLGLDAGEGTVEFTHETRRIVIEEVRAPVLFSDRKRQPDWVGDDV